MRWLRASSLFRWARLIAGLWNREYHDSRIILEQQGDLKYLVIPAKLQRTVVRASMVTLGTLLTVAVVMTSTAAWLQTRKLMLEHSHREIFAALQSAGINPELQGGEYSQDDMLEMARAIRERDVNTLQSVPRVGRKKAEQIILDLADKLGLTLLTGQMGTAEHKRALLQIVSGKAQIVVGTHALISTKVEFFDLGLIVIDEQHRFGVEQREALRLKGKKPPHVLTMTATPIPRTLAVSVFGDLDISTLTELPAGRQPIVSHVVQQSQAALVSRTWSRIAEEVAAGRQAFVVCSRIDESEAESEEEVSQDELSDELELEEKRPPLATVIGMTSALKEIEVLKNLRIEMLHGRMSSEEKEDVMNRFAAAEIDVLVSTTVIEVGVDVPNATVMVVIDADRFGISQLHQLRGRVGRGGNAGLCLLLTAAEPGSIALERVQAVASTLDGFKLSEIDLELRREGDVLGANQSGARSSLKLLRVIRDSALIQDARTQAEAILAGDPTLEKNPQLAKALNELEESAQDNLSKN